MMNYGTIEAYADARNTAVPVERENLKMLMRMTNERLTAALMAAEMILSDIRGAFPRDDSERANASSAIDAERQNSDLADHLCGLLKEIASQLGVGT